MSETVSNAFLLLFGQIGLFLVGLLFGLPLAWMRGDVNLTVWAMSTFAFVLVLVAACAMMVANIIIGWDAVRKAHSEHPEYSSKLFISDLLVIFVLFGMNNVIIASIGNGFGSFDPKVIVDSLQSGIEVGRANLTLAALVLLSSVYLGICKSWNAGLYALKNKGSDAGVKAYEKKLSQVIVIQILLASVLFVTSAHAVAAILGTAIWVVSWIFINYSWISGGFNKDVV